LGSRESAGSSPAGVDWAARHADFNYTSFTGIEQAASYSKAIRARAFSEYHREIRLIALVTIVCRDTEAEAQAAHQSILDHGDYGALENLQAVLSIESGSFDEHFRRSIAKRFIVGGGHALWGTPEQIVDGLREMSAGGIDAVLIGMIDYLAELPYFEKRVMPLLRQAGLRI
jgi:alkanesulfonate monooxygenase SsuD/methylene tetrahydromethanopterin reductase-like flavin-dependent oxidoreductase (luciferase family)